MSAANWYVYILRCCDDTLYTGVTTDCDRRLREHNHGLRGAKYTRGRRPVTLAYREAAPDRATAQRREAQIRRLSAAQKETLIATNGT
ncbi:MAG: GIY-YIG nuclease family protein [Gammaproteobacteria bacterium]|nr:GIY-YIG nuclease family protein [Gammaproteobacteria bacterium]